jgi:hypothetical protein
MAMMSLGDIILWTHHPMQSIDDQNVTWQTTVSRTKYKLNIYVLLNEYVCVWKVSGCLR